MQDGKVATEIFRGWLMKWTNYIKGYQKRWFVLSNGLLSYYRYVKADGQTGQNQYPSCYIMSSLAFYITSTWLEGFLSCLEIRLKSRTLVEARSIWPLLSFAPKMTLVVSLYQMAAHITFI